MVPPKRTCRHCVFGSQKKDTPITSMKTYSFRKSDHKMGSRGGSLEFLPTYPNICLKRRAIMLVEIFCELCCWSSQTRIVFTDLYMLTQHQTQTSYWNMRCTKSLSVFLCSNKHHIIDSEHPQHNTVCTKHAKLSDILNAQDN